MNLLLILKPVNTLCLQVFLLWQLLAHNYYIFHFFNNTFPLLLTNPSFFSIIVNGNKMNSNIYMAPWSSG